MTSEPLEPESLVVKAGDRDVASAAWPVEGGWYLVLTLQQFENRTVAHVIDVAIITVSADEDLSTRLESRLAGIERLAAAPPVAFRYRWMRDIGQQYERSFIELVNGHRSAPVRLRRAPKAPMYSETFYALVAQRFVGECAGSLHALAEAESIPWARAKEWITRATALGLITRPGRGRRGARQLTPKSVALLTERGN
jgi:hypothetical protein